MAIAAKKTGKISAVVVLVHMVLGLITSLVGAITLLKFLPDLAGIQLLTMYPGVGLGTIGLMLFQIRDVGSN